MVWLVGSTVAAWIVTVLAATGVVRGPGILRRLRRLMLAVLGLGLSALLTALVVTLRAWDAFQGETLVATVTTRHLAPDRFELRYVPAQRPDAITRVELAGDQWSINGGIVKWHPWLTALGVKSYHQPMRLEGRFSQSDRQRAQPPTVASLHSSSSDAWWEWCYHWARGWSVIEAVYGSSAYVYVEPGMTQAIYVTPSGYLIKPRTRLR